MTLTANGLNQYSNVGGTSFSYDGRGNLTGDGSRSYGYDVYNRLTGVSGAGSMSITYDPAGRLFETAASGSTTRFLYDGTNLIAEYDTSGNLLRRYVQGAGSNEQLVWYEGSGTSDRRYLVQDELGTVVAADGPSGVTTYAYDEYGNPNSWNGPSAGAPRFRYAGAIMLPEAQAYSMRARVYAPSIGRFLQTDPILFDGGMNLYAYTENDPVNNTDITGLEIDKTKCDRGWCEQPDGSSCTEDGKTCTNGEEGHYNPGDPSPTDSGRGDSQPRSKPTATTGSNLSGIQITGLSGFTMQSVDFGNGNFQLGDGPIEAGVKDLTDRIKNCGNQAVKNNATSLGLDIGGMLISEAKALKSALFGAVSTAYSLYQGDAFSVRMSSAGAGVDLARAGTKSKGWNLTTNNLGSASKAIGFGSLLHDIGNTVKEFSKCVKTGS